MVSPGCGTHLSMVKQRILTCDTVCGSSDRLSGYELREVTSLYLVSVLRWDVSVPPHQWREDGGV